MESYLQGATKHLTKAAHTAEEPTPSATQGADSVVEEQNQQVVAEPALEARPLVKPEVVNMGSPETEQPEWLKALVAWIKEDWLMKLGGLLIILGLGWFVSYAIGQGWIGEMGRIGLGFVVGTLILVLGRYRMSAYPSQGGILMFVGALAIVLTLWAARELYGFFTPSSALAVMFLTSSVLGLTSVMFKRLPLAYGNVAIAAVAPLLTAAPEPSLTGLFMYLLVLAFGAVWVAALTGWRQLILMSLGITFLYSLPFLTGPSSLDISFGLFFSFVFTALYFSMSIFGMQADNRGKVSDVLTAGLSGLFLLLWVLMAAGEEWQSLLLVAWTIVFGFGAFTAVRHGAPLEYFYSYASVGVVLLGVATAVELDGPALTIAFILEAAAVLVAGYAITRESKYLPVLAVPAVVPLLYSLESMTSSDWRYSIMHGDGAVLALILAMTSLLGTYFYTQYHEKGATDERLSTAASASWGMAGLYALVLVWLVAHALIHPTDAGTMIALITYTLAASALYIMGKYVDGEWQRLVAGLLIAFVMFRLLLFEVWEMDIVGRVFTFLIIGVLFVVVAWIERSDIIGRAPHSHE